MTFVMYITRPESALEHSGAGIQQFTNLISGPTQPTILPYGTTIPDQKSNIKTKQKQGRCSKETQDAIGGSEKLKKRVQAARDKTKQMDFMLTI